MYKVILVPAGCGQSAIDVGIIETNANTMTERGFDLVQVLQTHASACVGTKSAVIMVFKQRAD
jgi:hypothetical protein